MLYSLEEIRHTHNKSKKKKTITNTSVFYLGTRTETGLVQRILGDFIDVDHEGSVIYECTPMGQTTILSTDTAQSLLNYSLLVSIVTRESSHTTLICFAEFFILAFGLPLSSLHLRTFISVISTSEQMPKIYTNSTCQLNSDS